MPGLAPLQPKVPIQRDLPTVPKVFVPKGPAADLVFVRQSMIDNVQRRPIVVKNIGTVASKATTVGCQGGGELPPPEKNFAFVDVSHAIRALAPGETYEHMVAPAPANAPITSYECSIRVADGERETNNNSFKWAAGRLTNSAALSSPVSGALPPITYFKKSDIALQSITYAEAHKTATNATNVSFRVNAKNMGNVDVANARIKCGAGVTAPEVGAGYWSPTYDTQLLVAYGGISNPGDTHVIAYTITFPNTYDVAGKDVQIICDLKPSSPADDTDSSNNRVQSVARLASDGILYFPLLSR
jgi:hypothetical protein